LHGTKNPSHIEFITAWSEINRPISSPASTPIMSKIVSSTDFYQFSHSAKVKSSYYIRTDQILNSIIIHILIHPLLVVNLKFRLDFLHGWHMYQCMNN